MGLSDQGRADLFLLGVILMFLLLTLIAFLVNEGKARFVDPVLAKLLPNKNKDNAEDEEGNTTRSRWIQSHDSRRQRGEAGDSSNESREMRTIVELSSSDEENDEKSKMKVKVSDTTCNL